MRRALLSPTLESASDPNHFVGFFAFLYSSNCSIIRASQLILAKRVFRASLTAIQWDRFTDHSSDASVSLSDLTRQLSIAQVALYP